MADDALACFTSLVENVPGWIADLESILEAAKKRQQELLQANKPVTQSKSPSRLSSLKSRKSNTDGDDCTKPAQLRPTPKHLTSSDELRLSQRKRNTTSVASGDQSAARNYRRKQAAVVYYDGETQQQFEKLVRAVGSSRNAIRKGKMCAKVDALSRSGSSCSESSCSSGAEDGGDFDTITSGLRHRIGRPRLPAFGRNDGTEAYDRVDGRLEKAQTLCERAAHQILRDGDCTLEVKNAKEHFAEALNMVNADLPALRSKAEKTAERRRRSAERRRLEEEAEAALRTTDPGSALNEKTHHLIADVPSDGDLEVDLLEVDDDSSDGEEFNISAFTLDKNRGRFALPQMRTTRLVEQ